MMNVTYTLPVVEGLAFTQQAQVEFSPRIPCDAFA
jgi:hypothetical protein